ncbi:site-specific DNA-methyltransferase [Pseudoflavonifractor sp. MCC625]|uniref:site-specific DNA-methyltransferase n=1 Tax=Pseudoflavonifractor sp. MCC625 TaxID=2592647 RepID=UPI001C01E458|nr:site-specific DNA-methyltransferase [Pseudoflavonifractor sp. MCC625]MBT9684214.1 site-specific DNA-methyltransferase [Pseudoflavonifractor sp. MCC625]
MENSEQLTFEFEQRPTIKGFPELRWTGKRPYRSTQYYPAQLRETYGTEQNGWINKIFWGDNLQVMSHLLKEYRGQIDLIYIDPPFDSKADYKKKVEVKGIGKTTSDGSSFEEKQYGDIWTNDEYLQFMYERLLIMRELLSDKGAIYLHCDYHKMHYLRIIMDEVFGADNHLNSLVWMYSTRSAIKSTWKRTHDDILFYKKDKMPVFNWSDEMVMEPLSESTIKKYKFEDEIGRYRLCGRNIVGSPIRSAKDVSPEYEITHPEWVVRDYLRAGKSASDYFFVDIENQAASVRTDYPTQKPEELLMKLIRASTNPGDLVFDCFMGSGTTQAVAMKLGRRFIGADINLGAIQTTTKRLLSVAKDLEDGQTSMEAASDIKYTGFEVYNVNNYDFFRNPVEARDLLISALEIQPFPQSDVWDGELDGRMVKIMPVNRIATKADLKELLANLPYKTYEKRKGENPNQPVERMTIICMGHEPDLKGALEQELIEYKVDIQIVDILRDKKDLQLKRDSEAEIVREGDKLVIRAFYPMNLLQKLSLQKEYVEDWRQLVDSIMIDWNYDGVVMQPVVTDVPGKNEMVSGIYDIPENAGTIKVKITDLLSESLEVEVR